MRNILRSVTPARILPTPEGPTFPTIGGCTMLAKSPPPAGPPNSIRVSARAIDQYGYGVHK